MFCNLILLDHGKFEDHFWWRETNHNILIQNLKVFGLSYFALTITNMKETVIFLFF